MEDWKAIYASKLTTADEAVRQIPNGSRVFFGHAANEPPVLVDALVRNYEQYKDVEIVHWVPMGKGEYCDPKMKGHLRHNAMFVGPATRKAVQEGRADYTPFFYHQSTRFFSDGTFPIDVAMVSVTPPDKHGYVSLGVSVGGTRPACLNAKMVIAQVNDQMPRTMGESFLHVSQLTYCVEASTPLPELGGGTIDEVTDAIGRNVASLVESRKATEITDISNQSSKEGIRIVLELKKGTDTEALKNLLYKKTRLEDTFGVNMLAVADGRPETLSLKQILEYYIEFQYELATRKYQTLLAKEQEKREIQEGLIKACDVIDLIIEILRGSRSVKEAKACLTEGITEGIRFKSEVSRKRAAKLRFTLRQAEAILEMRLYRLIGLEIEALLEENKKTLKNIAEYEDILENHESMTRVILRELDAIKRAFSRPRRARSISRASSEVSKQAINSPSRTRFPFCL